MTNPDRLVLLNSRNREVFSATATDPYGAHFTYRTDNGGGSGPMDMIYRAAAVCMVDVRSARPSGPLAGLFRQYCDEHRAAWPFSALGGR